MGFFFGGGGQGVPFLGGFCDWFGEGWRGGGWVWGGGGKLEVEQQNNWGHNMLPWKEGSCSSKALHAYKTAHRQEEKFLSFDFLKKNFSADRPFFFVGFTKRSSIR